MGIFSKFFIFWVNEGKTNVQNEFQSSSSKRLALALPNIPGGPKMQNFSPIGPVEAELWSIKVWVYFQKKGYVSILG